MKRGTPLQKQIRILRKDVRVISRQHDACLQRRTEVEQDRVVLVAALKDAVAFMDRLNGKKHGGEWTVKDVKRIEVIRLLSLGV